MASNLSLCEQTENKYIYENQQNLALGYMVNPGVTQWKIVEGDPFVTQNDFVENGNGYSGSDVYPA